ncbi:hypothetical protein GCM10010502_73290 [Kitasatospora aureofaciens]|uniref:Uncharacterized protein n=1 Tax=Kitasatospora aureofaciens TaxID=1894 RepID=A0A8H9I170_KITAU|nr:hypothetical protein B6264_24930 [Kitasatospora aureofaciens]GGV07514.1 hypothetical protein GCM10010502_73290 [Kitasatospora aureofaciens]
MTRIQLTDEEWEFIGPHLPVGGYARIPSAHRSVDIVHAMPTTTVTVRTAHCEAEPFFVQTAY